MSLPLSRRQFLGATAAVGIASDSILADRADKTPRVTGMGLVMYDCNLRRKWLRKKVPGYDLFEPQTFLEHGHSLGAGGVQVALGTLDAKQIDGLRDYAGAHDLYIEAIIKPPKDEHDKTRFEAEVSTARDVGALAARTTIIPGRRYERFKNYDEFQEFAKRGHAMVERAVFIVEKYGLPLVIENHKDERIDQRVALLKRIDSEFVGACVDTGNSFALLDGVYEPIEALAPFAHSVHLKDQALKRYADGFVLGDVPLGQGSFDIPRIVQIIRSIKPDIRFSLELITRDGLLVPCLTDEYWQSVPEASGAELASTLKFVESHPAESQRISPLPLDQQAQVEDTNIGASLAYAGRELGL